MRSQIRSVTCVLVRKMPLLSTTFAVGGIGTLSRPPIGPIDDVRRRTELERLRRENAALRRGASSGIRMKVSEKGAVSIYGMGRFPVTLYKEQWLKLLDMAAEIRAFIAANESQLKAKE